MPNLMVALSNIGGDGAAMAIFWRPIFAADGLQQIANVNVPVRQKSVDGLKGDCYS